MKDRVGIGIIGTGFARKVQIPAFAACEGAELISVASGSVENAKAAAEEFGFRHFTDDWHETVTRDDVDLVCITTPPNLHKQMALDALENGKHVLCEKPMAMNAAESEEMIAAADGKGVLTLIDFELRFQPGRQTARRMIRDGEIGKIRHAKWNFRAPARGNPNIPWNWWSDAAQGGGALGAINSHVIDSFHWFLDTGVASVFCQLQSHVKQRPFGDGFRAVTTDDEANMLLRFADSELCTDATGLVSVSMVELPEYVSQIELFGTEGAIMIDHAGRVFITHTGEGSWKPVDVPVVDTVAGYPDTGFPRGFMGLAPRIIDAVRAGGDTIEYAATFEDGLKVQRVEDAARESNRSGCAVKLLP
jgi:predicted dehydrogenase